jgi:glycosyltransferase involved in cell wall biosynthesis
MKLIFFITSLGMGGAENILSNLTDGLVEKGYDIKIVCLRGDILVKPKSKNIKIVNLNFNKIKDIIKVFNLAKSVIREFKPDIVHAHMFHAIILARLLRLFVYFPKLICTAHSKSFGGIWRSYLYRFTDLFSDLNTNVSDEATEFFIKNRIFKRRNTMTVTNGIDTEKFKKNESIRTTLRQQFGFSDQEFVFVAIGRFNEAKDYPNLLRAFSLYLQKSSLCSKLVIIGDGELRIQIEALIIEYKLENNVILLGIRKNVSDLLNIADVFVLSSAWEGFGLVIAEAMSTERVVIATDCGGVKEVLGDERFLVPVADSNALSDKMLEITQLTDAERTQIGYYNRQRILKEYSLNTMVDQWLKIYTS